MSLSFRKSTDSEQEIKLDSYLISAMFEATRAVPGQQVAFEVLTGFVGDGANIKVKGKTEGGGNWETVEGVVRGNSFSGHIDVPEDAQPGDKAFFEVKIRGVNIDEESDRIPVVPPVRVSNMAWSAEEARRGDLLVLSADVTGLREGTEVQVTIYEHDADGAHDRITELPGRIAQNRLEVRWLYEYHEDTDEILTQEELNNYSGTYNPPEYFFTIKYQSTEFGREQESGILTFKDWVEIVGEDPYGRPLRNTDYVLRLADGNERRGTLDEDGFAREEDIPPGSYEIEFEIDDEDSDDSVSQSPSDSSSQTDTSTQTDSSGSGSSSQAPGS